MPPPGYRTPESGAPVSSSRPAGLPTSAARRLALDEQPAATAAAQGTDDAAAIRARAVKAAMQPLQAKLDKMAKQRQARARSRSRDASKREARSRSRSREPAGRRGTDVLSRLSRAMQLAITVCACLILMLELLVVSSLDGVVLPGLPDPPGELITLSHGKTHYQLHAPRPASATRRGSAGDANASTAAALQPPVVVCIHGVATYSYVWEPLLERLSSERVFVLTYYLWGHGHSDGAPHTLTLSPRSIPHTNLTSSGLP
eukprot:COSAG03_NODE_2030_length_3203_cov_2.406572_4_plen_259_part_00